MVDKNDKQKEEKTLKLRVRSNTEDVILKDRKDNQNKKDPIEEKKEQNTQYYDEKMRDVWGARFVSPTKQENKNETKPNSVDRHNIILQNPNKVNLTKSPNLEKPKTENKVPDKKIDKEHVAIEKIFRISLTPKENFYFMSDYVNSLEERNAEKAFRIKDLDSIIITIVTSDEKKNNIFPYLLESYYRAYEMIDKKYKSEFDQSYQLIKKIVVSYINFVLNAPENFDINIERSTYYSYFKKFYAEKDSEYIENFLLDFSKSTSSEIPFLKNFFDFYFEFFYQEISYSPNPNFYNHEKIRKHLKILTKVINDNPIVADLLCESNLFFPKNSLNGKSFQINSFIGTILSLSPIDCDVNILLSNISTKSPEENKRSGLELIKIFNVFITEVSKFIFSLLKASDNSRKYTLKWFYEVIFMNVDRKKTYFNPFTVSKLGFLLNISHVLIKILYDYKMFIDTNIFNFCSEIQPLFSLTNNINFSTFERINSDSYKEILENYKNSIDTINYNLETKLFFTINAIFSYTIRTLESEFFTLKKKLNEFIEQNATSDSKFKECACLIKAYEVYIKNQEFCRFMLKFININIFLFFMMNNSKYTSDYLKSKKIQDITIIDDFNNYWENTENKLLSSLPLILVQNIMNVYICLRFNSPEILISEMFSVRQFAYFSVIYSSNSNFITTSHYRAELLDLVLYIFSVQSYELKQPGYSLFTGLLQDPIIMINLIPSLMKSFIDAERLGTPNQFYQKFSNRSRIFTILLDVVLKYNKNAYVKKITEFANKNIDDSIKMINLMMNDVTYLNDEAIEKLEQIKIYQDLRDNQAAYDALDEEAKKFEDEKFINNDRIAKVEIRLLNQSIQYMTVISNCCSQNFIKSGLTERLAHLLNYSLSIFTTSKGMKLKVKNMKEYGFDPKMMLINLVSIYNYFRNYKIFLTNLVNDQRSFKIEHFEKVVSLYNKKKIEFKDMSEIEGFIKMIDELKVIQEEVKKQEINYDDAPEEFLDQLNYTLMNDPVLLPSSKVILDRFTIETHLLSDQTDPFNRSKLTKDMLIPCHELKEKIEEYKKSKKK